MKGKETRGAERLDDLHKRVVQTHHSDNQRIHTQGKHHQYRIKLDQRLVFLQAIADKFAVYRFHKVKVQHCIHQQVNTFFAPIPDIIEVNVSF